MGKILVFKDGTEITFADSSIITDLQTVTEDYADIDALRAKFTEDNLSEVIFDGTETTGLLPVLSTASADVDGNVTVHFINKFKTDVEIANLKAQVAELEAENATLSDKAEAADILLGNEEVES